MNTCSARFFALLATAALVPCALHAAPEKYQVTGPIMAMDAGTITVMKGKEKFVIGRDASTKMTAAAEPKVGDKVTVYYTMTAAEVEAKADKKKAAAKPDATGVTKETKKAVKDVPTAPASTAMPTPAGVR